MDKAALFLPRLAEEDLDLPGIGTVRVRALNRAQVLQVHGRANLEAQERLMISFGMVSPELTEAEVGKWAKAAPAGELQPVSETISRLSGLMPDGDKEAYKSLRDEPDPGV